MSNKRGTCTARNFGMLLVFLAFFLTGTALLPSSSQGAPPRQVLVIHSYHMGFKWTDEMTQGITAALRDEGKVVQVRFEYMDTKRVSDPAYFVLLYETYKYKYRTSRFDVIIATDNDAFDFLKQYRDPLFPATPVVFCGVNYFEPSQLEGKKLFTGVNEAADIKATLDLALRLHPATRQIVVINDKTTTGRIVHREVESLIPVYKDRVRFLFLEELEMPAILEAVRKLGPDNLVFYGLFFRDKAGRFYEYDEGISLIAESCPVPVYGVWDFYLGYGLVGGMLTSGYSQGETAGQMALRILRGEKVENIPVVMKSPNRYMFDYRQLQRFHIDMSALPAGSIVINRPSSLYHVPRQVFWGAVAALIGSVLIISFLLYNTAIRRRAERELRNAALKYRIVADNTYNWEFWLDPEGRVLYSSPSCQRVTGHTAGEFHDDPGLLQRIIHPDDKGEFAGHRHDITREPMMGELEFRIVRQAGDIRWLQHVCLPVFDDSGKFIGTRASNSDITERKRAQDRLACKSQQLEELNQSLEERVETTIHELRQKDQMMIQQSRLAAMGEMINNIAHQWRQPLNTLGLIIQKYQLDFKLGPPDEADLDKTVNDAMLLIQHMSRTIDDFRNFFKLDKEMKEFKVCETIDNAIQLIKASFDHYQIKIVMNCMDDPVLHGYQNEYSQAILNILSNAKDAFLARKTDNPQVIIDTNVEEGRSVVTISDNAGGIPDEILPKVFDPLFTTKGPQGTGIGLFMAKNIIEKNMNGRLSVRNNEAGAEFRIEV